MRKLLKILGVFVVSFVAAVGTYYLLQPSIGYVPAFIVEFVVAFGMSMILTFIVILND